MKEFEAKSLCILGRQPTLGLAELESLYGAGHMQPLPGAPVEYSSNSTGQAALLDVEAEEINFKRLGGTIKVARLLTILPSSTWAAAHKYLTDNIPKHLQHLPAGTFTLGISVYGLEVNVRKLAADLLSLKKIIKATGRSVRIVPNKTLELNSAQVLHNKLTHRGAWELLLVRDGKQTYLAQTFFVQDIEAYAARDQARPKRDARVGMLPPKLAQILINLAVGQVKLTVDSKQLTVKKLETNNSQLKTTSALRLLDPFCGTGVILQEALLMGYHVLGTDIEPRMVDYAQANIQWLVEKQPQIEGQVVIEQADATLYRWPRFSVVASEVYLGRPLSAVPAPEKLNEIISDVNTIIKKFLQNLAPQLKVGQRVVLAVPAWRSPHSKDGSWKHLPLLDAFDSAKPRSASTLSDWPKGQKVERVDNLTSLGYNRRGFVHVANDDLIYFRENQIVARELLVLSRD